MSKRNCIYTGLPAEKTDKVVPKEGGDESHNWINSVPCSVIYKEKVKKRKLPSDLEVQAHKTFAMLELARLDVARFEKELVEIQKKICKINNISNPLFKKHISKNKQIEIAYKEKEVQEMDFKEVLDLEEESKKMRW